MYICRPWHHAVCSWLLKLKNNLVNWNMLSRWRMLACTEMALRWTSRVKYVSFVPFKSEIIYSCFYCDICMTEICYLNDFKFLVPLSQVKTVNFQDYSVYLSVCVLGQYSNVITSKWRVASVIRIVFYFLNTI